MKKSNVLSSIGILAATALALTACGKSGNNQENSAKEASKFPAKMPSKPTKQGGTVRVALQTDTPFTGIFSDQLQVTATDADISSPGSESLFDTDDNYRFTNKGPATLKINNKNKTITIVVKKGVRWSDGRQVTAKDVEYPYEILSNKGTDSQRYSSQFELIKGLKEYHEGKAKSISGIEMPDGENGRRVILHFKQLKPGMYNSGNGYFSEYTAPYHYLKNVPFNKLQSSNKIRKKPLYFGAYKLEKLVRGQSAVWVPNKYYWRGKPKLDRIIYQVISPNSSSQSIKSHKFDVINVVNSQWDEVKHTKKVKFIAEVPLSYWFIGFKLGKWDAKHNKSIMNHNSKMNNTSLRRAIGYAMNVDEVTKHYTHGLTFHITTLIPPQFGDYFNKNVKGYDYNLKKANDILDKAGYKKKGKWRVQPNGKPLKITFMAKAGDPTQGPIIQNYIQQWHKIGLNVNLLNGRLTETNSFYDKLNKDDPQVDMFETGWYMSTEPSQDGMYGDSTAANYDRFVTPENTKLLKEMDSQKAFDHKYRVKVFHDWQQYIFDKAYMIPTVNSYKIRAINDHISGYSLKPSENNNGHVLWYKVGYIK